MAFSKFVVLIWAGLLATATMAGEQHRTRIAIDVDESGDGQVATQQTFTFDSHDEGFELQDMAVGEVRTLTDADGNMANVTRTESGFEFDLDGKTIELAELHEIAGLHGEHEIHIDPAVSDVVVVDAAKKVRIIKTGDADDVTVIADHEFDIDDVAGVHGVREVRIIRKEVDVTN